LSERRIVDTFTSLRSMLVPMTDRPSYKTTLFDRLGPDAAGIYRSLAWGMATGALTFAALLLAGAQGGSVSGHFVFIAIVAALGAGAFTAVVPRWLSEKTGQVINEAVLSGNTTPYTEQHSYQQALVMQGRLDEALASLEAVIAEEGSTADVRIRAAELYTREAKNHARAAELFREVIRDPRCTVGEEVYSANRLADLLNGPLGQPGRAIVELARLADRYPKSVVGERARQAIRSLKALAAERDQAAL
jgi:hypothetical protein